MLGKWSRQLSRWRPRAQQHGALLRRPGVQAGTFSRQRTLSLSFKTSPGFTVTRARVRFTIIVDASGRALTRTTMHAQGAMYM